MTTVSQRESQDQGSSLWRRARSCVVERRMPSVYHAKRQQARRLLYRLRCRSTHHAAGIMAAVAQKRRAGEIRCLYATAVNGEGKAYLEKIINRIDLPHFDVLVFCYDETAFDEAVFSGIKLVRERGFKWQFVKKYVTPAFCAGYDYIFVWDDDIDPLEFSFARFIDVMRRNYVECAQPGISPDSHVNVDVTRARGGVTGRFTDYVENMAPVFTRRSWARYWAAMEEGRICWGWQHSATARSGCGFHRMGIIDQERVAHTRPFQSRKTNAPAEAESYYARHPGLRRASRITYAFMR